MDFTTILVISIALAMDAFTISITTGITLTEYRFKYSLRFGSFFGIIQFLVSYTGYLFMDFFNINTLKYSNFIAAIVLITFGVIMLINSYRTTDEQPLGLHLISNKNLILLSLSSSVDAVTVGISLSTIELNINSFYVFFMIGFVSFILSGIGIKIGKTFGCLFKNTSKYLGGFALIFLGTKLFFQGI